MSIVLKGHRYRMYPTKEQDIQLSKTFGCCRFVYNQMFAMRIELYREDKKSLSKTDCNNYCNREIKKGNKKQGFPKYKSKKKNYCSYKTNFTNDNIKVLFDNNLVQLPKLGKIKTKLHRKFDGRILSANISKTPSGKYF